MKCKVMKLTSYYLFMFLGLFSIDNSTGQITLSRGLDREQASSHVIIVKAYDGGSPESSNSTNITITVEDVNDNSPVITPTIMNVNVNEVGIMPKMSA